MFSDSHELAFRDFCRRRQLAVPIGTQFLHLWCSGMGEIRAVLMQPRQKCCSEVLTIPDEAPRKTLDPAGDVKYSPGDREVALTFGRNVVHAPADATIVDFWPGYYGAHHKLILRAGSQACRQREFYLFGCNEFVPQQLFNRLRYVGAYFGCNSASGDCTLRFELFELIVSGTQCQSGCPRPSPCCMHVKPEACGVH